MADEVRDPGMGIAAALNINEHLFYEIFFAGDKFETDKRYQISDHIDLTEKAKEIIPEFLNDKLPIFCDNYFQIVASNRITPNSTLIGICESGNLVSEFENEHPERPDSWEFMGKYLDFFKNNEQVIILPRSKKIIQLVNLTIEQIIND